MRLLWRPLQPQSHTFLHGAAGAGGRFSPAALAAVADGRSDYTTGTSSSEMGGASIDWPNHA